MTAVGEKINKGFGGLANKKGDLIFCLALLLWPTIQFAIFYVGVNINSILLCFQKIDFIDGVNVSSWGLENFATNFKDAFTFMGGSLFGSQVRLSLLLWILGLIVGTSLGLMFSYFIYKKLRGYSFFRTILFLPSIISITVVIVLYKTFVNFNVGPAMGYPSGITDDPGLMVPQLIFFCLWFSFGTSVLMYSNAMCNISTEVVEAAELDGATGFKEFWHISLPGVYSTFSVFFVNSIAGICTNQYNVWTFYGTSAPEQVQTIGYYIFQQSHMVSEAGQGKYTSLAAFGIILTIIAVPITLGVRKLLERYGPSSK